MREQFLEKITFCIKHGFGTENQSIKFNNFEFFFDSKYLDENTLVDYIIIVDIEKKERCRIMLQEDEVKIIDEARDFNDLRTRSFFIGKMNEL